MSSTNISHFLLCSIPAWGHVRPLCTLATRLVCEQETIIATLIVTPFELDKTKTEVSRQFLDGPSGSSKALQRIRVLSPSNLLNVNDYPTNPYADAYAATYQTLYDAKPITCCVTGTTFDAAPTPCAVILDFVAFAQLRATRAVSGHSVPIVTLMAAGCAGEILRSFGPEYLGGAGDRGAKIDAEAARTGLSADVIAPKILYHTEGKLIRIPGFPVMPDYEFFPQEIVGDPVHKVLRGCYASFRECDTAIVGTSYAFDPVSLNAVKEWFSEMQKELHVLGPLLPPGYGTKTLNLNGEEGASVDIEKFLGEMLVQHGERSIFFISFGSFYWPPVQEYVDELIEALIAKRAPFILAYASPIGTLSEKMSERIQSSGLGMITKWAPQQYILNHPATGWFISHGGFNSVTESLASGIPLIFFPIIGDQPVNAAHVTENLRAAFELFQVRSGKGLKLPHRNGLTPAGSREAVRIEVRQTIDLCRSEKGQEIRSNAEKLKVKFVKAWEENGAAKQEIRNFLNKYART